MHAVMLMTQTLKACGIAQSTLDKIPGIISTCRECRVWAKGGKATVPSVTLSERFNQHVECDLMFYKQHIIFHLMCRCTMLVATLQGFRMGYPLRLPCFATSPNAQPSRMTLLRRFRTMNAWTVSHFQ